MKALKLFFLLVIGSLSIGAAAQDYEVKGVVIDANGNPVVGATVRTNKSKTATTTKAGGVYTLTATPKDTELRLIINKYTVMEKELSATIASNPIAFELDETNDPSITGYSVGDTYYPGTADVSIDDVFKNRFPEIAYDGTFAYLKNNKGNSVISSSGACCIDIDGSVGDRLTVVDPQQIYSIKILRDGSVYGQIGTGGAIIITTKAYHETNKSVEKADISVGKDSIRGVVKDGWGRVVPGMKIRTSSGEEAISDENGKYAIRVTNKDKYLRCVMDYVQGTTVRISKANAAKPVNLIVMLRQNDLRGWFSDDMTTYYPGAADGDWSSIMSRFPATKYENGNVMFDRQAITSINNEKSPYALIVLDGVAFEEATLESVEPHSVYSVKVVKENAVPLYGAKAQYGAVVITTRGMGNTTPVASADLTAVAARQKGGEEGMKEFIASQGKNLEYDDAGYILVNGKRCELYIINDSEFTHMRGIDISMIDDIIILNDDYTASYGPRAKNGVVLISASQKEKRVVDENGNTVTEKEYKQQQKNKKSR